MSDPVRVLRRPEIELLAGLDRSALAAVREGFVALSTGRAIQPPVLHMEIPARRAELDVKTAYLDGLPLFAVKISSGFFENAAKGLPSLGGGMVVLDSQTGRLAAVLLDDGYLTDIRTALAGAVAADALARRDAATVAIVGTGLQARLQARALTLVRPIRRVCVAGRDSAKSAACAADIAAATGLQVTTATTEDAVTQADVVVTTTPASEPVLRGAWLRPGTHVTAMGSDAPYKRELDGECLRRAALIVVDSRAQSERLGELRAALAEGAVTADLATPELGAILAGCAPSRAEEADITICDLTGTGAQDTAIAAYTLERASASG